MGGRKSSYSIKELFPAGRFIFGGESTPKINPLYSIMDAEDLTVRASWWSLTLNNPTDDDRTIVHNNPPRWLRSIKGQDEIGGKNNTLHIQMVLNTDQVRASSIKEWLRRAHIKAALTKEHKANLMNYVHKQETAVPGTQFQHQWREENKSLSQAQALMKIAELAWTNEQCGERLQKYFMDNGKHMTKLQLFEEEFWECVCLLLGQDENLVSIYTQPQYIRAWTRTRPVWIKKVLDSQTDSDNLA